MLVRLIVVVAVVAFAFAAVWLAERLRVGRTIGSIPAGLTLVSRPGCRDCVVAKERFDTLGAPYRVVGVEVAVALGLRTFTMPMAFVGSDAGAVVMIRRGASVVSDAEVLVAAAT